MNRESPRTALVVAVVDVSLCTSITRAIRETCGADADILFACAGEAGDFIALRDAFSRARFVFAPPGTSAERLRVMALRQVDADIIRFITADASLETGGISAAAPMSSSAISVVVAMRNAAGTIRGTLGSLLESDLPRSSLEIVAVDDCSTDGSGDIAARFVDALVRLRGRPFGPAYCRNRGVEVSHGEQIVLLDADTTLNPDTLSSLLVIAGKNPQLGGVSAAHDTFGGAANLVSQYWNLLLRFGEHHHGGLGSYLGDGCSIVRREAIVAAGLYDEWRFTTPSLEGIELGGQLREAGFQTLLDASVSVRTLRRWSVRSACSEAWKRSIKLARSVGYQSVRRTAPAEIVLTLSRAAIPSIAMLCTLGLSASLLNHSNWIAPVIGAVVGVLIGNFKVLRFFARVRGLPFAIAVAPVHFALEVISALGLCVGWMLRDALGDSRPDATVQAYREVGVNRWPPVPKPRPVVGAVSG